MGVGEDSKHKAPKWSHEGMFLPEARWPDPMSVGSASGTTPPLQCNTLLSPLGSRLTTSGTLLNLLSERGVILG